MEKSNSNQAQNYIEEHKLEPLMADMLNTLVYHKSRRPEIFLIKYLSQMLSKEERLRNGIHVPDDITIDTKTVI